MTDKFAQFDEGMRKGLTRTQEYIDRLKGILEMMGKAPAEQQNPIVMRLFQLFIEYNQEKIDRVLTGRPLVMTWYGNCHELYSGMGILAFNPVVDLMMHLGFTDYADAKSCDSFPLDQNVCSLVRYAVYSVTNCLHPRPNAFVAMEEPCDGQVMLHQAFKRTKYFRDVPCYGIDPSYGHERSDFEYVAEQLFELVRFLEKTCGVEYKFENLAKVVRETNKQYMIQKELCKCMMASPAPLPSFVVPEVCWPLTQHLPAGNPAATELMQMMLGAAKANVEAHVGPVMNEQVRILWPDLDPLWNGAIGEWLAKEWNAVVVQTFQGNAAPYQEINTTDEHEMFVGLASRMVAEVPMIRQGRGWVDVFQEDVNSMIADYNCNAVIFSGHMGHKDQSGATQFLKRCCRDSGVPLLALTTSLFDERYTPLDRVKNDISNFLSAAGFKPASQL